MSTYAQPAALQPGDVVSPLFNPDCKIVYECWYPATLAEALPGTHAKNLEFDHPCWMVFGNRYYGDGQPEGEPTQLTIFVGDDVRLHITAA